jgi:hypothetical protein
MSLKLFLSEQPGWFRLLRSHGDVCILLQQTCTHHLPAVSERRKLYHIHAALFLFAAGAFDSAERCCVTNFSPASLAPLLPHSPIMGNRQSQAQQQALAQQQAAAVQQQAAWVAQQNAAAQAYRPMQPPPPQQQQQQQQQQFQPPYIPQPAAAPGSMYRPSGYPAGPAYATPEVLQNAFIYGGA